MKYFSSLLTLLSSVISVQVKRSIKQVNQQNINQVQNHKNSVLEPLFFWGWVKKDTSCHAWKIKNLWLLGPKPGNTGAETDCLTCTETHNDHLFIYLFIKLEVHPEFFVQWSRERICPWSHIYSNLYVRLKVNLKLIVILWSESAFSDLKLISVTDSVISSPEIFPSPGKWLILSVFELRVWDKESGYLWELIRVKN